MGDEANPENEDRRCKQPTAGRPTLPPTDRPKSIQRIDISLPAVIALSTAALDIPFRELMWTLDYPDGSGVWRDFSIELGGLFSKYNTIRESLDRLGDTTNINCEGSEIGSRYKSALDTIIEMPKLVEEACDLTKKIISTLLRNNLVENRVRDSLLSGLHDVNRRGEEALSILDTLIGSEVYKTPTTFIDLVAASAKLGILVFRDTITEAFANNQIPVLQGSAVLALASIEGPVTALQNLRDGIFDICVQSMAETPSPRDNISALADLFQTISSGEETNAQMKLRAAAKLPLPVSLRVTNNSTLTFTVGLPDNAVELDRIKAKLLDLVKPLLPLFDGSQIDCKLLFQLNPAEGVRLVSVELCLPTDGKFEGPGHNAGCIIDRGREIITMGEKIKFTPTGVVSFNASKKGLPVEVSLPIFLVNPEERSQSQQLTEGPSNFKGDGDGLEMIAAALRFTADSPSAVGLSIEEYVLPVQVDLGQIPPTYYLVKIHRQRASGGDQLSGNSDPLWQFARTYLRTPDTWELAPYENPLVPEFIARAEWLLNRDIIEELSLLSELVDLYEVDLQAVAASLTDSSPSGIAVAIKNLRTQIGYHLSPAEQSPETSKPRLFIWHGYSLHGPHSGPAPFFVCSADRKLHMVGQIGSNAQIDSTDYLPNIAERFSLLVADVKESLKGSQTGAHRSWAARFLLELEERNIVLPTQLIQLLEKNIAYILPSESGMPPELPNVEELALMLFRYITEHHKYLKIYRKTNDRGEEQSFKIGHDYQFKLALNQ
jgi:hypothetical protein